MKIKKMVKVMTVMGTVLALTVGCTSQPELDIKETEGDELKITTTIFPIYDWVRNIVGDDIENTELAMVLDTGVDLHSYQPTAQDIITIGESDVFIYVGGHSDAWVEDVLAQATNEELVAINLMALLGDEVKAEEQVEGMQAHDHEHEEAHDHEHEHEHDEAGEKTHDHEHEEAHDHDHVHDEVHMDEHVWLSLKHAETLVEAIASELVEVTGDTRYEVNAANYTDALQALDSAYEEAVAEATMDTLVFVDRFPFRYLLDDYDLSYYAAFSGCSAETEASFETIIFLANQVDALGVEAVIELEDATHDIGKTVVQSTTDKTAKILEMNALQSVQKADVEEGITYLETMEKNLEVLKQALQ